MQLCALLLVVPQMAYLIGSVTPYRHLRITRSFIHRDVQWPRVRMVELNAFDGTNDAESVSFDSNQAPSSAGQEDVDVSPAQDRKILKNTQRFGDISAGKRPRDGDEVQLSWKIFHTNRTLAHSSEDVYSEKTFADTSSGPAKQVILVDAETGKDIETIYDDTDLRKGTRGADGSINVEMDPEPFSFRVNANPREVILGWEHAVKSMYVGEIASFTIHPSLAFGTEGVPGVIEPNEAIFCELEVLKIVEAPSRVYRSIGENEDIHDELMEKIQSGKTPIATETMDRTTGPSRREFCPSIREEVEEGEEEGLPPNFMDTELEPVKNEATTAIPTRSSSPGSGNSFQPQSSQSKPQKPPMTSVHVSNAGATGESRDGTSQQTQVFDPAKHRLDPRRRIFGEGADHVWEETALTIDITIPLDRKYKKNELQVTIRSGEIKVMAAETEDVLFEGKLFGRVAPADSMWSIEEGNLQTFDAENKVTNSPHITLSLEKAIAYQEIWASALDQEYLGNKNQKRELQ